MGYGSRALLTVGALALALCVLATASGEGLRWTAPEGDQSGSERHEESGAEQSADPSDRSRDPAQRNDDDRAGTPAWLPSGRLAALVVLAALVALLLAVLGRLRVSLRRRRLSGDRLRATLFPAPQPDPDDEAGTPLTDALDGALEDVGRGSPRNAIVAAWLRLEEAAESAGSVRNPADTPSEFVERVLASSTLDADAIGRLAALYREARFSAHQITDSQRDEARACLAILLEGLRTRTAGGLR